MRILQILRAPIGGLYRHVVDLSTALAARGHELGLVMDSSLSDPQTAARLEVLGPMLKLGLHKFPISRMLSFSDLATPVRIRRLARQLDVEVLHGHGAKGGLNARVARIGSRSRIALYTPHGGVLNFAPDGLAGKAFRQAEALLLLQTNAIVFESQFAHDAFSAQIVTPKCLAPVIHNGLSKSEFIPVPAASDAYDFVFVGELRAIKGVRYLLDALVDVKTQDGRPATLIMAGGGPLQQEVEAQIAQLDLQKRVRLAGVQSAREMFARGRCMVVPSLAESLPYVILEAAAAAKPVIATDVGGVSEIFGPTAMHLVPSADAEALRIAMQAFMDDEATAQREMAQRLKHVRAAFSLERMADAIEALYFQALSQG